MIKKALDWDALANSVNSGTTTYSGKYFKLTTDIDNPVTTMVGNSEQNAFQGFFIGNGKKLIVNYVTEEQYTAPFRYIDGATFTGTYAPVSIGDTGDNTKLYLGSGNKLYYPHAAMHINAFRSYFQLADGLTAGDPTTGARVLAFKLNFGDNDGDTAGIVSMSDVRSKMSDVWFDLSGRRLSSKPTQRGVYINGGIKVVIK